MSPHARLSPSSASGWMVCAAFPDVNAQYPDESGKFAAEGSFAHAISDFCLTHGFDASNFIGVVGHYDGFRFEWTEDDADLLQPGIDWVREQAGDFYGEARVDLSEWLGPDQGGTVDRFIVSRYALICGDLKWGRGVPVKAIRNKQACLYTLGGWKKYAPHITDPKFPVIINIDQPRHGGGGGIWKTTLGDLWAFGEEARAAAQRTHEPNPKRVASEAGCLWCKGKDDCLAFAEFNMEMLGIDDFEDLDDGTLTLADRLTPERRRVILDHRAMIEKWLEGLHAAAYNDAMHGYPTGGLKLVEGRKNPDGWKDRDTVDKLLRPLIGEKRLTKRLIGPTAVSKLIPPKDWENVRQHIRVGEQKYSLVPEEDERPSIVTDADPEDFDDLD